MRRTIPVLFACIACRPTPVATTTPTSTLPAKIEPADPATTGDEIDIADVACTPVAEPWERALAEAYAWSLGPSPSYGETEAKRLRASAVIDQLPASDPRYVEAHCRAAFAHHNMMNVKVADRHLRLAIAELRKRGIADPEARYATAATPAFSVSLDFDFDPKTTAAHRVSLRTTIGMSGDPDTCPTPDIALLELERASLYGSANRTQMRGIPRDAAKRSVGSMSADTVIALHDEIVAALGPRHPLVFAMREHVTWSCDEAQERKFPRQCPTLAATRERNFADRTAVLGAEHPQTRYVALFLGGDALEAGKVDEARRLFEIAASGEADISWITANQLLAGLDFDARRDREGFARLQRVAQVLPSGAAGTDWYGTSKSWMLHEMAARATGHDAEAERAAREREAVEASHHYVGPGGPSIGLLAATEAGSPLASLRETAVNAIVVVRTHELRNPQLSDAARAWRTAELDTALQCRALMHHRAGNDTAAKDDLRALAGLRRAGPRQ